MSVQIRLRPEAGRDLGEAATWYERQRPGLGSEFLDEAVLAFAKIAEAPTMYPEVHRHTRRILLNRFPFGVFYRLEATDAVVVAIMHGSRHPRRWQSRT